jgi:hypothetical protein
MTDVKKRVLFLCIHNSARSQMAAAYLKQIAGDRFDVESAGLEPGKLNPLAVAAMMDGGIDISHNRPSAFGGTSEEQLRETIRVRDEIRERVRKWVEEENSASFSRARRP